MRVGVPYHENSNWIAGSIYMRNLEASLRLLPDSERPELVYLAGPRRSRTLAGTAEARGQTVRTYGYFDGSHPLWAGASALASLAKGGSARSLTAAARAAGIDILFPMLKPLPLASSIPWMGWVPDYQCMALPELWPAGHRYKREVESLSRASRYLVVSSEEARGHAERFFARTSNIGVLPFSILFTKDCLALSPQTVADHFKLPERFLLFPSQFWKHKDHETLLKAIGLLRKRGHRDVVLVLAGWPRDGRDPSHAPSLFRLIAQSDLQEQVRVLGLIERSEVIALMRRAVGVVQPSRFEGWSALVEEARSLAKPLVLSDIDVHKEQNPPNAHFFRAGDQEDLAAKILHLWNGGIPGPHLKQESDAGIESRQRASAFARRFVAAATDAIRVFGQDPIGSRGKASSDLAGGGCDPRQARAS